MKETTLQQLNTIIREHADDKTKTRKPLTLMAIKKRLMELRQTSVTKHVLGRALDELQQNGTLTKINTQSYKVNTLAVKSADRAKVRADKLKQAAKVKKAKMSEAAKMKKSKRRTTTKKTVKSKLTEGPSRSAKNAPKSLKKTLTKMTTSSRSGVSMKQKVGLKKTKTSAVVSSKAAKTKKPVAATKAK